MPESASADIRRAFATGTRLDLACVTVPAELLVSLLAGEYPQAEGQIPALRLTNAVIQGPLALPGATVNALVELTGCTFDQPVDLYAADLAGWRLIRCALPGLHAANLRVRSELTLQNCTVKGAVTLPDARIEGPLRLTGTRLHMPDDRALVGVRLTVSGVLDAKDIQVDGEIQISGAQVDGNVELRGAQLINPGSTALEASGVKIGGNLRCDRKFTAEGKVVLAGASVSGNAVFATARLRGSPDAHEPAVLVLPRGHADSTAALVADRMTVSGNLELDAGFTAEGSVRVTNAKIGGHLRLSGAKLGTPTEPDPGNGAVPVALAADGIEVRGDLEARRSRTPPGADTEALQAYGQVRLVGAHVYGSASLTGIRLHGPGLDVLFADRLQVGGTLFLRRVEVSGSIRLHNANIGSNLDCTGARLDSPRRRLDGSVKPSLDARAANIGKDCFASYGFTAAGGVRLSLAEVSKSVSFDEARLGGPGKSVVALRLRKLKCGELRLRLAERPQGHVLLTGLQAGPVRDSALLWQADGRVDVEDFTYESITSDPAVDVTTRLRWLRKVLDGSYDPDPYDQLAASYRDGGHDDLADTVLLAKQQHRRTTQRFGWQMWGLLQEWSVGFGYRPWRAVLWLAAFWILGSLWFFTHPLQKLDDGQHPSWQPVIYAADLLIPVVNLGQDGLWQTTGASAWVAGGLTTVGWLLLSTVTAGVTRILTRR